MQQVLYIGWWNTLPNRNIFIKKLNEMDYNPLEIKKWRRFTLQEELWKNYQVALLDMPNRTCALYKERKIQFEKIFPYLEWDQILIAHSLWTIFILKYLTENKFPKKIKQFHLVSAYVDDENMPPEEAYIGDFAFDITRVPKIQNICEKIFLYHSKDDKCVPFSQWERLHEFLPNAKFEVFEDRWHMNIPEFPELIENIKNN